MAGISLQSLGTALPLNQATSTLRLPQAKSPLKPLGERVEGLSGSDPATATPLKEQARLKKACQDFESIFLNYMLSKMRESVPKDDLMGGGNAENIYRGMLDEELSKQIAAGGGMGLGNMLYRQLSDPEK
jgi:peptidoglycan hydrolase FlgJ